MVWALTAFHAVFLLAAAVILVAAAVSDARRYKIPNLLCATLVILFPLYVFTAPYAIEWDQHLMVCALVLISGFTMFVGNLAGAGDIKLLAAAGLWAGPHYVAVFLITTAVAGGVLALLMAVRLYARRSSRKPAAALAKVPVPYGIAIALGGLCVLYEMSQPLLFPV